MRMIFLALGAITAVIALDVAPAAARDYPICMRSRIIPDDCNYSSMQQCMAMASGLGGSCEINPRAVAYGGYGNDGYQEPPRRRARRDY